MQIREEIVKRIYPKNTILKYSIKNTKLNSKNKDYVINFLFIKLFASILIFFLTFIIIDRNLVLSITVTIFFNIIYNYYKFDKKLILRQKQLEKDASLFFEVLLLSLKSGKNLNDSINMSVTNIDNLLTKEIKEVIDETKYGKSLIEAINDYIDKIPSDNIKNIFESITENYISGKDMIPSIKKQTRLLNEKRINDIKTYINKLPIKISVISVFILIPLMLLLILSPVIIDLLG